MARARTGWLILVLLALLLSSAAPARARSLKPRKQDTVQRAADRARRTLTHSAATRRMFGLTRVQIHKALVNLKVSPGASRYESRGWARQGKGRKALSPRRDRIVLSPLLGPGSAAGHESRHALHHAVASSMFVTSTPAQLAANLRRVERGVLKDRAFVDMVKGKGTDAQRRTLNTLQRLVRASKGASIKRRGPRLQRLARGRAAELGALVYQHAYFVDPGMCEAAASFGDRGFTRLVTGLNGVAGRAGLGKLPGAGYLTGYGNKKMQAQFRAADSWKKALLVTKANYDRAKFFNDAR